MNVAATLQRHRSPETSVERSDDDAALAVRAQHNVAAFDHLFDRFFDQVYWYSFQIVRDPHVAEDVTSEVFEKVMIALPKYRSEAGSFRSWLFRIAHNVAIDAVRRNYRRPVTDIQNANYMIDPAPGPEEWTVQEEERLEILGLLNLLSDGDRRVIELRLAGLDAREICQVLHKSRSAVDSAQSRAVAKLQLLVLQGPTGKEHPHVEP